MSNYVKKAIKANSGKLEDAKLQGLLSSENARQPPKNFSYRSALRSSIFFEGMHEMANVLIADDSVFMRSLLRIIINRSGNKVIGEACNGKQAVELFNQFKPDLVLMDLVMDEMTGLDALKSIMNLNPKVKVIICSSLGDQFNVKEALRLGAKDYIIKPFTPEIVNNAIKKAL